MKRVGMWECGNEGDGWLDGWMDGGCEVSRGSGGV